MTTGWQRVMARHDEVVRRQLRRFDGREVKHTGDGFRSMFDAPAHAIRCATAILQAIPDQIGSMLEALSSRWPPAFRRWPDLGRCSCPTQ